MDLTTAWQLFISLGVFTALGVSLVNAYARRQQSKAAEPHDYAKSYQVVVQTRDNLAKSLKEEQRQNKLNQEKFNKKLDKLSTELSSVLGKLKSMQYDARVYVKELRSHGKTIEEQGDKIVSLKNELDLYKDTVQYLWLGTVDNIKFMRGKGLDPPFEPKLNYRGDNDFDYTDWEWLDSPPDGIGEKHET